MHDVLIDFGMIISAVCAGDGGVGHAVIGLREHH